MFAQMHARDGKMNKKMEMIDAKIDKQKDDIITSLIEKFQKEVEVNKSEVTGIKEQMMDIETNLKVMQNLVEENVVLLDRKVKEGVELKSEFENSVQECREDRVKTIEDRMDNKMKKFEKSIKM